MAGADLPHELKELLAELGGDGLDAQQLQRLEEILCEDAEARRLFHEYVDVHLLLEWMHSPLPSLIPADASPEDQQKSRPSAPLVIFRSVVRFFLRPTPTPLSLAVATLVMCAIIAVLAYITVPAYQRWAGDPGDGAPRAPVYVAELSDLHNAVWVEGQIGVLPGAQLVAGHRLRLKSGLAEITFRSGAQLLLEGPAELALHSTARTTLEAGRLTAQVPEQARGFTVETKQASIVDWGTEFGVSIDPSQAATVRVYEGRVVVAPVGANRRHTLLAGERLSIAADGTPLAMSAGPADIAVRFVREMPDAHYERVVASAKPLAWWRFEDPHKAAVADRSGGARHGVFVGGARAKTAVPGLGRAVNLAGDCYVEVPNFADLTTARSLSVEAWVRGPAAAPTAWERVIEKDYRSGFVLALNPASAVDVQLTPGRVVWGINNLFAETPAQVCDGRWHHLAGVWDGAALRAYVDGQPGAAVACAGPIGASDQPLRIGAGSRSPHFERLHGAVDEIAIYDRALTAEEIKQHHEAGRSAASFDTLTDEETADGQL